MVPSRSDKPIQLKGKALHPFSFCFSLPRVDVHREISVDGELDLTPKDMSLNIPYLIFRVLVALVTGDDVSRKIQSNYEGFSVSSCTPKTVGRVTHSLPRRQSYYLGLPFVRAARTVSSHP